MRPNHKCVDATYVLNKAILNTAVYLELTQKELSQIVGSSTPQINRLFKNGVPCINQNTKEWECALLFLRLIRSLEALIGEDASQAREWLYSYNHHLAEKPIDLIKSVSGLSEVVVYLDAMRGQG